MKKEQLYNETMNIFLAVFWGGGGSYSISQIIHVYDWSNHAIPGREEMEYALNYLLENNLIKINKGNYYIPKSIGNGFDKYRKKVKKRKFAVVKMYFNKIKPHEVNENQIEISEKQYKCELNKYREFMRS